MFLYIKKVLDFGPVMYCGFAWVWVWMQACGSFPSRPPSYSHFT